MASNIRIISRLDIKGTNLIKGIHLEGLRKIGDPNVFAKEYYEQGIDEIIYIDVVASLYERSSFLNIVRRTTQDVFIPITVGGGVRSVDDAREILRAGADKVAVNTAAVKRPELIHEISQKFGAQCMVLSIEAKRTAPGKWEVYYDNGREKTGFDVLEWAQKGCELGAGEILLTSVDMEGTGRGFDCELTSSVSRVVSIPVIASGGLGTVDDFEQVVKAGQADAVAIAGALHYKKLTIQDVRIEALQRGIHVRRGAPCNV
ncbi:imidazole glycerol phosphate synthase subunit HisF [Geobacter sp.]|uniref:imidazole glycerol phosphate synthase subunit HisF n=1 Tax=Geobacter sp. TaxID=46610 RepID=UPI001ACBD58A|nr:imidazole glycerol phosphate synthase cyclase subunit [Geobacter sp.]CAG0969356.1 cyclase [Anaerolineae bacterium]